MRRTRKNVHTLAPSDDTLVWYGKAVKAMRALPRTDPLSWDYQAAIHGLPTIPPLPLRRYWAQCQHATSFFLPWHRMYLLHFERIVAAQVALLSGPANWALPYWNYSDPHQLSWRELPAAFRAPNLPDGSANPLFEPSRKAAINGGGRLSAVDVDLRAALIAPGTTGVGGFFGSPTAGHFSSLFGELEGNVHNNVHMAIGGFMGNPNFAALDPIFWLHHANIDRLWEVWRLRDPAHVNLTTPYWLTGVPFDFHDASGTPVTMRTADVLVTTAPALDYEYDDTADPLAPGVGAFVAAGPGGAGAPLKTPDPNDLVGATVTPIALDEHVQTFTLPTPVTPQAFKQSAAPGAFVAPAPASQLVQQVTLHLENVTSLAPTPVYDVYLNVPGNDDPSTHPERFVGRAAMFGIALASDPAGQHGGSGQTFVFDITSLYHLLDQQGDIDPQALKVSFVPVDPAPGTQVQVGRVSIYFG